MPTDIDALLAQLDTEVAAYQDVKAKITATSLRIIKAVVRRTFGAEAVFVPVDYSDQGSAGLVWDGDEILDAEGVPIVGDFDDINDDIWGPLSNLDDDGGDSTALWQLVTEADEFGRNMRIDLRTIED